MRRAIAWLHLAMSTTILGVILLQFYSAGMGIFGAAGFELHRIAGGIIDPVSMLLVVIGVAGGLGWRVVGLSTLLTVLIVVQVILPGLRDDLPWVAALHPVNALALLGVAFLLIRAARSRLTSEAGIVTRQPVKRGDRTSVPNEPVGSSGPAR